MTTTEARYATPLHEWLPSQPECHAPYLHVKARGREKELRFDCWTTCSPCVVAVS